MSRRCAGKWGRAPRRSSSMCAALTSSTAARAYRGRDEYPSAGACRAPGRDRRRTARGLRLPDRQALLRGCGATRGTWCWRPRRAARRHEGMARGGLMKITICGIPELGQHCAAGVTHVLSILDPGWPDPEAFADFSEHRRVALRFNDVIAPLPGVTAPTAEDVAVLLEYGREVMAAGPGTHLLIHCHA